MKVGIDARLYNESGVGRYIRNLIHFLQKLDQENEYFVLLQKEDFNKLTFSNNFQKIKSEVSWYSVSEQIKLPRLLSKYNLDVVHFPHFNVPIFYRGKFIVTIHDLIHQKFKMRRATTRDLFTYHLKQLGYHRVFSYAVRNSQKVITVSNFVKNQLEKDWQVPSEKIIVTYEAVDDSILKINDKILENRIKNSLEKLKIKPPFIFYVGNAHPHKNVEGLIQAFLELRKRYQYLQLVLAGNNHYFWARVKKENPHKDIVYAGFISDEELVALYKSADCFVMPSFEEGFGIPLLEAFASNCPVVSSSAGSLPEVGGDAALYFDPYNKEEMVEQISTILNSQSLKNKLIEKGQKRYKQFSWEKLAKETLEIYQNSA